MSDSSIGLILSIQYAVLSLGAPFYGNLADDYERKYPHYGRGYVLIWGIACGTLAFGLHGLKNVWASCDFFRSIVFHYFVQILYALNFAVMFPVLDGMTLDYLQSKEGNSINYGKERLHGAISWGIANLILGKYNDSLWNMMCLFSPLLTVLTIFRPTD
jgi:MFS family permease